MEYKTMDKEILKEVIVSNAELKSIDLNKDHQNWYNMGIENLVKIAEAIDATPMPEPEAVESNPVQKTKGPVSQAVINGGTQTYKQRLLAEPTVYTEVPEDELNGNEHVTILVCGVEFIYARGEAYEMPKPVAEVYRNSRKSHFKTRKKLKNQMIEIKSGD